MKVVIIEDENPAVKRLKALLNQALENVEIVASLDTVTSAIKWFHENDPPDLAFFDIQLADGRSFEIFDQSKVECPVIFTTAYDQYALKAFEVNSIDYLLKPIDEEKLNRALQKFNKLYVEKKNAAPDHEIIKRLMEEIKPVSFKERFVVKYGDHLKSVEAENIACFFSFEKATFFITDEGKKYLLDQSLEHIESLVDPLKFFRISRKYIVSINAIKDIITYSNSRLKLILHQINDHDMIVAREKVQDFKTWLDK